MTKRSGVFTYGILITLLILIGIGGYYLYQKYGRPSATPLEAIPLHTGAFIKVNKPGKLVRDLHEKNDIWQDLLRAGDAADALRSIVRTDSILVEMGYSEFLDQGNIFIALVEDSAVIRSVVIFNWPYGASEDDLKSVLSAIDTENKWYYEISKGLCMMSLSPELVDICVDRLKDKSPLPFESVFERVDNTSGRNVDANIYINFQRIPELAKVVFASSYFQDRRILPDFGTWSAIDLLVKDDELLMNGYTEAVDTLNQFLSLFRKQEPRKIEITRVLPYNTSMLVSFGFSDFEKLHADNAMYLSNEGVFPEREQKLTNIKNRYGPNVERYMTEWVGNELALAMINPHLDDRAANTFVAIHASDIEKASQQLLSLSSSQYTTQYRDYTLSHTQGGPYGYKEGVLLVKKGDKTVTRIERNTTNGLGEWTNDKDIEKYII